ncbi:MAG TPA: winged helix DNA-binding domain-containing protein [Solirubrobacteraceae bacterium]|nr:winged helix DNA-binding domain-containing protein [Solirubrobacteraceae bacterium]
MLAERLNAQLLAGPPARDPVAVCERLLAVQGQDPRAFRLAVRARTTGLTAADVDRALTEDRSLVVAWLNRGTLHLVRGEDYWWLHALTAPRLVTGALRRLDQEGVRDPDRAAAAIERALAEDGPLTRDQVAARVDLRGQAVYHALFLAAIRAGVVRGPVVGRQHAFVLARDWLGEPPGVDPEVALAELARRYLAGHGPAGERDLAQWAGLPLRDARAGLKAIAGELEEREAGCVALAGRGAMGRGASAGRRAAPAALPPPRLLGGWEPVLLGWASREPIVGPHRDTLTVAGLFRSFAMVGGRAVATWRLTDGKVELSPLEEIAAEDAAALEEDAADVRRFLGL